MHKVGRFFQRVAQRFVARVRRMKRRWKIVWGVFLVFSLSVAWSIGSYMLKSPDEPFSAQLAGWMRNHHLGWVVDQVEEWRYSDPPSNKPADELAVTVTPPSTVVTTPPSTEAEATTTTVDPRQLAPAPLENRVDPALPYEGQWAPLDTSADGLTSMWVTSARPLADYQSVVATFVVFDPLVYRAALHNGSETPGGKWEYDDKIQRELWPQAVAAFNGGFRFEHYRGGYMAEGRVVKELRDGEATVAIDNDGVMQVGLYGRDFTNDGSWASLRQNLPPVVDKGRESWQDYPGTKWGDDGKNAIFVFRTALCSLEDGRLMYVAVDDADIELLARTLVYGGCQFAVELDENYFWPCFVWFYQRDDGKLDSNRVDDRMHNPSRYVKSSKKDFFVLYRR